MIDAYGNLTNSQSTCRNWKRGLVFAALASVIGCGSASDSEVSPGGGTGGAGAGSGGVAGTPTGTGGTAGGAMATGGSGGAPAAGGNCPVLPSFTLAVHIIMDATWPATSATGAGAGKIHLWNRAKLNANGTVLSGDTWSCGTVLPEFGLNFAGQLVTGGSKVSVEVPHKVWDAPSIPKFPNSGTLAGWNPGSAMSIVPTVALVGLTMTDPMAAWPASYTGITVVDAEGDGKPGFTAVPKDGMGYVAPPTKLGVFGSAPAADLVYLASRTVVALNGKLDSCTEQSGTTAVSFFDSHVVGCHVQGGAECTPAQVDFVDQSRTAYKVSAGTFRSKQVPDNATCADVRAAFPMTP